MPVRQIQSMCNLLAAVRYYKIYGLTFHLHPIPVRFSSAYVRLPLVDIPATDYAAVLVQAGLDEGFAGLIAQWDADASNGAFFSEDKTLEKLLGRPTSGLDVAVKQAL